MNMEICAAHCAAPADLNREIHRPLYLWEGYPIELGVRRTWGVLPLWPPANPVLGLAVHHQRPSRQFCGSIRADDSILLVDPVSQAFSCHPMLAHRLLVSASHVIWLSGHPHRFCHVGPQSDPVEQPCQNVQSFL